jgi:dihydroflavonol-4-reductase
MKALVTGSTGFIGANLVQGLAEAGHQVRALHRRSSRLDALKGVVYESAVGNLLEPASLRSAVQGVDWVFHVAAVSDYWRQPGTARLYHVNVGGTRNVLQAALDARVRRVVFTSSAAAVGLPFDLRNGGNADRPVTLVDESIDFNLPTTLSPYGHSKHLAERVAEEYITRGLEVVMVNPTVVLGPRDLNLISGSLILAIYRRRVPVIPPGGVNYVDVADVVAGHLAAAEKGRVGERYLLGAYNMTHQEAAERIAGVLGVPPPSLHVPGAFVAPLARAVDLFNWVWPGEPLTDGNQVRLMRYALFYDTRKAQRQLGLEPSISFENSVERTFRWYRDNGYL